MSVPRPQNRYKTTPLLNLRKFTEKWKSIKARLTGESYPTLTQTAYLMIQQYFVAYVRAWQNTVPPKRNSHFYHYNFIIIKTLQYFDFLYKTDLVKTFRKEWLLPTTKEKIESLQTVWAKVFVPHLNMKVCLPTPLEEETLEIGGKKFRIVFLGLNTTEQQQQQETSSPS